MVRKSRSKRRLKSRSKSRSKRRLKSFKKSRSKRRLKSRLKSRSKSRSKRRLKSFQSVRQRMQNEEIARQALGELSGGIRHLTSRSNIELICPYCGLSWSRNPGLPIPNVFNNHVSSEERVSNAEIVLIDPTRRTYLCQVCGKYMNSLNHATMHITRCPNRNLS
jgi:hypothetical protein